MKHQHLPIACRQPVDIDSDLLQVEASAAGKAIIIGEHAVVYGARAVAIPLRELRLRLTVARNLTSPTHEVTFASGHTSSHAVLQIIDECLNALAVKSSYVRIHCDSMLPVGAGLGASAAFCVALIKGLAQLFGVEVPVAKISKWAHALEHHFHGRSSGLDTTVVSYERLIDFSYDNEPGFLCTKDFSPSWNFALIDTGVRSSTLKMIRLVQPFFANRCQEKISLFNKMAEQVCEGLRQGRRGLVADAMTWAASELDQAGVVTDHMHQLSRRILQAGALAVKSTGAGGGGCLLALLPATDHAEVYRQLCADMAAYQLWLVTLP